MDHASGLPRNPLARYGWHLGRCRGLNSCHRIDDLSGIVQTLRRVARIRVWLGMRAARNANAIASRLGLRRVQASCCPLFILSAHSFTICAPCFQSAPKSRSRVSRYLGSTRPASFDARCPPMPASARALHDMQPAVNSALRGVRWASWQDLQVTRAPFAAVSPGTACAR